jgi:hypothetical protein
MKSAVDIFYNSVMDIIPITEVNLRKKVTDLYQIAKTQEKINVMNGYNQGSLNLMKAVKENKLTIQTPEQYYNETFKK